MKISLSVAGDTAGRLLCYATVLRLGWIKQTFA
jgi:hypothetical protein